MNRILETVKRFFHDLNTGLVQQTWMGEVWQPRCYTGDPNWQC